MSLNFSRHTKKLIAVVAFVGLGATAAIAQMAPFGAPEDVDFAGQVWAAMESANLVGPNQIRGVLTEGSEPHGSLIETFYSQVEIDGRVGAIAVKRNYGPAGVDRETIYENAADHLGGITVMFQREAGYDDENDNWFWVGFKPDGSLMQNGDGMNIAGKVAKGMDQGCIACHVFAPGDDYLYTGANYTN